MTIVNMNFFLLCKKNLRILKNNRERFWPIVKIDMIDVRSSCLKILTVE